MGREGKNMDDKQVSVAAKATSPRNKIVGKGPLRLVIIYASSGSLGKKGQREELQWVRKPLKSVLEGRRREKIGRKYQKGKILFPFCIEERAVKKNRNLTTAQQLANHRGREAKVKNYAGNSFRPSEERTKTQQKVSTQPRELGHDEGNKTSRKKGRDRLLPRPRPDCVKIHDPVNPKKKKRESQHEEKKRDPNVTEGGQRRHLAAARRGGKRRARGEAYERRRKNE